MKVIPVLDLMNGVTVQAVAGRRHRYRPIRSQLTDSVDPSIVLQRLDAICQSGTAYIADLDAILRQAPNRRTLAELSRMGIRLMVDAGVQSVEDAQQLFELGIESAVIGLESLPDLETAKELLARFDPASLILSVDLKNGMSLARYELWQQMTAGVLLEELSTLGFKRWIILDIASVGTSDGVSTLSLCRRLRTLRPDDEIITGGGLRNGADLQALAQSQIDGVLIASALHTGRVTATTLNEISWTVDTTDRTEPSRATHAADPRQSSTDG